MNIETLSEKLYDDLNGVITCVDNTEELTIYFECNNWNNYDEIIKFKITCHDVVEKEIQPSPSGDLIFTSEHHLLWKHNEPYAYLYYSSAPENRYEILGKLWTSHEKIFGNWRHLSDYINVYYAGNLIEFCTGRCGQVAHGPQPLIEEYEKAISGLIETKIVPSHLNKNLFKALIFDSGFVICKSVTVE